MSYISILFVMRIKSSERLIVTFEASQNLVILGAGSIGTSFAAAFSDVGWNVVISDPNSMRSQAVKQQVHEHKDAMALAGLVSGFKEGEIDVVAAPEVALKNASLVLECGPEDLSIKREIFAKLLDATSEETLLATASSAILISQIVTNSEQQSRCIVAHPVNPPSVLRLVELCPAPGTSEYFIEKAKTLFATAGFQSAVLGREIEGFILNRLQGAVLREAYRLVDEKIAEPKDIDNVMRLGLGPRWALSGPFETAELNTPGGIAAHATRMGPAYKRMGEERGESVEWTPELVERVVLARNEARGNITISERAAWRCRAVAQLVAIRDRLSRGGV